MYSDCNDCVCPSGALDGLWNLPRLCLRLRVGCRFKRFLKPLELREILSFRALANAFHAGARHWNAELQSSRHMDA